MIVATESEKIVLIIAVHQLIAQKYPAGHRTIGQNHRISSQVHTIRAQYPQEQEEYAKTCQTPPPYPDFGQACQMTQPMNTAIAK